MRRICWTVVYLVVIGLPIAGAAEPIPAPVPVPDEPEWRAAAPAVLSLNFTEPLRTCLARWQSRYAVQRPAWPTPSPTQQTVYPTAPVTVQRASK